MKNSEKKTKKKLNFGMILFNVLSLLIVLYLIYLLIVWNIENKKNKELQESLVSDANITTDTTTINDTRIETLNVDFNALVAQNKETVGWIRVKNTNINYPVVQAKNNTFYLNHAFNKSYNKSGSIFADYKNNLENFNQNTILYGHNRRDGSMFSSLNTTMDPSWHTQFENQFINFSTLTKSTIWEIFSIYKTTARNITLPISFSSDTQFLNFVDNVKQKSVYDFNVSLTNTDPVLTLYTCGNNTSQRVIVHAKLVYEKQH